MDLILANGNPLENLLFTLAQPLGEHTINAKPVQDMDDTGAGVVLKD